MAVAALRWFKSALLLQMILLAYWLAIETVDLFSWNDLASRPGDYDLAGRVALNALQQLAYMGLFALGVRWLATLAAIGYGIYLAFQLWHWWSPYAMGADAAWRAEYLEQFGRTLKLFPADAIHLAPDAQHIVLQLLTLAVVAATIMAITRMRYL